MSVVLSVLATASAVASRVVDIHGFFKIFGLSSPVENIFAPQVYPSPEWIGVKIESIYNKQLPNYSPQTTMIQTDKPPNADNVLLRNVDQDLKAIERGSKYNSGNYEVSLKRALQKNKPLCLEVYGKRIPQKSEFKNIIKINTFPTEKNYEKLTLEERDAVCLKHKDFAQTTLNP